MKKDNVFLLLAIVGIGAFLFFDQVRALFRGMGPLEAMQQIITFVLHVAVATIVLTVLFGLPAIVKPWVRMFRWKQKAARRAHAQRGTHRTAQTAQHAPGTGKDQVLWWMLSQMARKSNQPPGARHDDEPPRIRLDL
jgi:uncharacterized membrane protein YcjF (UPF0283 family)